MSINDSLHGPMPQPDAPLMDVLLGLGMTEVFWGGTFQESWGDLKEVSLLGESKGGKPTSMISLHPPPTLMCDCERAPPSWLMIGCWILGGVSAVADGEAEFCITWEVKTIWDVTEQGEMRFLVSVPNRNTGNNMIRVQHIPTVSCEPHKNTKTEREQTQDFSHVVWRDDGSLD